MSPNVGTNDRLVTNGLAGSLFQRGSKVIAILATLTYALHAIHVPAGWAVATPMPGLAGHRIIRPPSAAMARNGTVGVLLVKAGESAVYRPRRLLILRPGRKAVTLTSDSSEIWRGFGAYRLYIDCPRESVACPYFESVALTRDGTPVVTAALFFTGAYSGLARAAFRWKSGWRALSRGNPPLAGLGYPSVPDNFTVPAAEDATKFAVVSDFQNRFAHEDRRHTDIQQVARDLNYMAEVSAALYGPTTVALGRGDVTSMSGDYVAGYDGGRRLASDGSVPPSAAIVWRCTSRTRSFKRTCTRTREPGSGAAFGVNAQGDAVGDDEPALGYPGYPVLWRKGKVLRLSAEQGTAYAIADDGSIVGASDSGGFVANARVARPRAQRLDPLLQQGAGVHVQSAFGIADDGRILALVLGRDGTSRLTILEPRRVLSRSRLHA